jgi:hypothetical protein
MSRGAQGDWKSVEDQWWRDGPRRRTWRDGEASTFCGHGGAPASTGKRRIVE